MEVESEEEQDQLLDEEGDEEDVTREVHAKSPPAADEQEDDTLHGDVNEYDSEETLEYDQEDDMPKGVDQQAQHAEDADEEAPEDVDELTDEAADEPVEEDIEDLPEQPLEELVADDVAELEEQTQAPVEDSGDETVSEPEEELEEPAEPTGLVSSGFEENLSEDGEHEADEHTENGVETADPSLEDADDLDDSPVDLTEDHQEADAEESAPQTAQTQEELDQEEQLKHLELEVEREFRESLKNPSNPGLTNSLVEGLEDVFVEPPVSEFDEIRDGSETEDDLEMQEAGEHEEADFDDQFDEQDMDDQSFDEGEPTLVPADTTIQLSPNKQPIQAYEVEEPEDSTTFSPTRQVYYRFRRVLSPVRVLDGSPEQRRHMSPIGVHLDETVTADNQIGDEEINEDPFVEPKQATPRRRLSTRRALFDNAPRFTPLAQQFSQWKASSPEKLQPRRSRRGVFSLGGGLGRSTEVESTPELEEVAYPDVSGQVQAEDVVEVSDDVAEEPEEVAEEPEEVADEPEEVADEPEEVADEPEEVADEPEEVPVSGVPEAQSEVPDEAPEVPQEAESGLHDEASEVLEEAQFEVPHETTQPTEEPQIYEDSESQSTLELEPEESRQPMAEMAHPEPSLVEVENDLNQTSVANSPTHESQPVDVSDDRETDFNEELVSSPAHDTQGENKENTHIPVLTPFTPMKLNPFQMQTVHTVSKVPLKPEGFVSPLKVSRKRGLSLSGASPGRSSRPRISSYAPAQGPAPSLSPRKSPRIQRAAERRSVSQPAETQAMMEQRPGSAKRAHTPSPTKKAKTPRKSLTAPKLPLQGAVVYVDVHTTEGEDASGIFIELLQQMGARCVMKWSWNPRASQSPEENRVGITHVVFKDGGVRTLEKVRQARGLVKCVGVGWVLDCERENKWLDESHYQVDSSIIPRGGAKRRKSMEPRALSNINGTLVKTDASLSAAHRRRSGIDAAKEAFVRDTTDSSASSSSSSTTTTPTLHHHNHNHPQESSSSTTPDSTAGHTEADQTYCHTPKTPATPSTWTPSACPPPRRSICPSATNSSSRLVRPSRSDRACSRRPLLGRRSRVRSSGPSSRPPDGRVWRISREWGVRLLS
ncbi:hypothetical protein BO70DRAFT_360861, partial [Aspergillus heteromorphus CBS 117.55]